MNKDDKHLRTWWDSDDLPGAVCAVLERARKDDDSREAAMCANLSRYTLRKVTDLTSQSYDINRKPTEDDPRIPMAMSLTDTVHAKLMRNVPKTSIVTKNADWTTMRQAEKMEAFVDGVKAREDYNDKRSDQVIYGAIFGNGDIWVNDIIEEQEDGRKVGRIRLERVFPWQIRVDPAEAAYGKPRSMFLELPMDRRVAMAAWPDHADAIAKADPTEQNRNGGPSYRTGGDNGDQVSIIIGWHLRSSPASKDGRKVVVCEGVQVPLSDEPYKLDRFPIVRFAWKRPLLGFHGHAFLDGIGGIHDTANELDEVINDRIKQSVGFFVNFMGEQLKLSLSNDTRIPTYNAPGGDKDSLTYYSPNLVSAELLNERAQNLEFGNRMSGVSEMSASGNKPAGLNSGVALREHQDIETERFTVQGEGMERADRDVTKLILAMARSLAERDVDVEVVANVERRRQKVMRALKWKKVAMPDEDFTLTTSPAAARTQEKSFQLALVEQIIAGGFIDEPDRALMALQNPDADAVMSMKLAPLYLVLDMISDMLEDGITHSPIPEMDLALAQRTARLAILQATMQKAPEKNVGLVRAFVEQCRALEKAGQQAAAQANPAAAMGNPEAGAFTPNAGQLQPGLPTNAAPQGAPVIP